MVAFSTVNGYIIQNYLTFIVRILLNTKLFLFLALLSGQPSHPANQSKLPQLPKLQIDPQLLLLRDLLSHLFLSFLKEKKNLSFP